MEAQELDSIENNYITRKPVGDIQSTRKPKVPKKMKGGMTRKVLPVGMFYFANNQMFFVNLMIEMTMGSRLLQIGHNTQP